VTSDHDHHFLRSLIDWEMGGDPTSFNTKSSKMKAIMSKHDKIWTRKWHESMHVQKRIMFGAHPDFVAKRTQLGCLTKNKWPCQRKIIVLANSISTFIFEASYFKYYDFVCFIFLICVRNNASQFKFTLPYDMWHVFLLVMVLGPPNHQPWPW
jgi:hypothetical protein